MNLTVEHVMVIRTQVGVESRLRGSAWCTASECVYGCSHVVVQEAERPVEQYCDLGKAGEARFLPRRFQTGDPHCISGFPGAILSGCYPKLETLSVSYVSQDQVVRLRSSPKGRDPSSVLSECCWSVFVATDLV